MADRDARVPASIVDLFEDDDDDDDIYEPATDHSTLASTQDESTEGEDYAGPYLLCLARLTLTGPQMPLRVYPKAKSK